jgi:hypothetical protein
VCYKTAKADCVHTECSLCCVAYPRRRAASEEDARGATRALTRARNAVLEAMAAGFFVTKTRKREEEGEGQAESLLSRARAGVKCLLSRGHTGRSIGEPTNARLPCAPCLPSTTITGQTKYLLQSIHKCPGARSSSSPGPQSVHLSPPAVPSHTHAYADRVRRGLGLAVATLLLEKFGAIVVAISRTKTPELQALQSAHSASLLVIESDVLVSLYKRVWGVLKLKLSRLIQYRRSWI